MNVAIILIVVASVGFAIAFASLWIMKRQKKKKVESATPSAPKQEKKADEFKLSKKGHVSRVSRRALDSNARTAKVERVFARTDEQAIEKADVEVETDSDTNLVDAVQMIRSEQRKTVDLDKPRHESAIISSPSVQMNLPDDDDEEETQLDHLAILQKLRANAGEPPKPKNSEPDFSDIVELDAILNPKFKQKK